ncbi:MAG: zinc ribbon domain-containing protein [Methanobrevibacter thaueri]|uniref:zinc ribbon domain-containing protein n=1 Tax=Methanobrevibacter thaueri TaxID=190975 RepID=UPI0026EFDA82|nr:zinc ribbon domain-containing protein [Methanobrevibacter thaueri]MBE6496181.1 zinc ribbon domain-containing protein [Methanobrevibacter thaueri]
MANYCTNCGTKLRSDDNFCYNCGTRVDNSGFKQNSSYSDSIDKKDAKKELKRVVGRSYVFNKAFTSALIKNGLDITHVGMAIKKQVEEEIDSGQLKSGGVEFRVNQLISEYKTKRDEENRKLQRIDSILSSEDIRSEIRNNNIGQSDINLIKSMLKAKIIDQDEDMSDEDIKDYIRLSIKTRREVRKVTAPSEPVIRHETVRTERGSGGYCGLNCRHCYEEFLDSYGGIVGDFDAGGNVEYYCALGHQVAFGSFCEYYE